MELGLNITIKCSQDHKATCREATPMCRNVQNIAYRPRSLCFLASPFLRWRVNIGEEMWALDGRVRASKDRRLEASGAYSGQGVKDEVFVGGCDRTGGY